MTNEIIAQAEPRSKAYKLADGGGLYVFVSTKGKKSFRLKYGLGRVEQVLTFGRFPSVSLEDARRLLDDAKAMLVSRRDLATLRRTNR